MGETESTLQHQASLPWSHALLRLLAVAAGAVVAYLLLSLMGQQRAEAATGCTHGSCAGLLGTVSQAVAPITNTVEQLTAPLTPVIAPVTTTSDQLTAALTPVTAPVTTAVNQVAVPVAQLVAAVPVPQLVAAVPVAQVAAELAAPIVNALTTPVTNELASIGIVGTAQQSTSVLDNPIAADAAPIAASAIAALPVATTMAARLPGASANELRNTSQSSRFPGPSSAPAPAPAPVQRSKPVAPGLPTAPGGPGTGGQGPSTVFTSSSSGGSAGLLAAERTRSDPALRRWRIRCDEARALSSRAAEVHDRPG